MTKQLALKTSFNIQILFWIFLGSFIIFFQLAPMTITTLFTFFLLKKSEKLERKLFGKDNKTIAFIIFIGITLILGYLLSIGTTYIITDFNIFLQNNLKTIETLLKKYEVSNINIVTVSDIYKTILEEIKKNIEVFAGYGTSIIKILLGFIFGIIFYYSTQKNKQENNVKTLFGLTLYRIRYVFKELNNSFNIIISTQLLIAIMNVICLTIYSTIITYLVYGEPLQYWYILIPMVFITSFIPVIGNLFINLLLFVLSLQVSIYYTFFSLFYFFFAHKLELIVIGQTIKHKYNIPFLFLAISMVIGELLFHSLIGLLLGMTIYLTLQNILNKIRIK